MFKVVVSICIALSFTLSASVIDPSLLGGGFEGSLPMFEDQKLYMDLYNEPSALLETIYKANSLSYSVQWVDTYIAEHSKAAILSIQEETLQLLTSKVIIGARVVAQGSQPRVIVDLFDENGNIETLSTIWEKGDDDSYKIVMLTRK